MELTREQQAQFAKELVPLVEQLTDPEMIDRLHKIAALVLEWSGFEDNGLAFDASEYSYEMLELARGMGDTGWAAASKKSLERQLGGRQA
jgi:flagellar biosynthesis regulator FlbT